MDAFNVQQYVKEERLNRNFIETIQLDYELEEESLVQQFLIIGSDSAEQPNYQPCGYRKKKGIVHPKVLFSYPETSFVL